MTATIISAIDSLLEGLAELRDVYSQQQAAPETPTTPEADPVTLEQVRSLLATLSRNGHTDEVKALITEFGADKLSDIDPANYADLLAAAEGIK